MSHVHRQSEDPRRAGYCACGQRLPPTRPRNLEYERQALEHATYGVMDREAVEALWQRMLSRSTGLAGEYVSDPMEVALDRDRPEEVRMELEDALNHGDWWLEVNPDHPKALERAESMKWLAAAYRAWLDD